MSYHYTDQSRENDPHALPDVEVFHNTKYPEGFGLYSDDNETVDTEGFYYAFGFPGCLWDSDPVGPFETEAEALQNARESAGF